MEVQFSNTLIKPVSPGVFDLDHRVFEVRITRIQVEILVQLLLFGAKD